MLTAPPRRIRRPLQPLHPLPSFRLSCHSLSPVFPAAFPQSSPMRDDPRLRGPKVLFNANALERDG